MAAKSPTGFLKLMDVVKTEKQVDPNIKNEVKTSAARLYFYRRS
jgi:hypothetical protein